MGELRRVYDSQDAIPEEYRDLYTERDGKFILQLSGSDPYSKPIDEFNRIYQGRETEKKQREELEKQLNLIKEKLGDLDEDTLEGYAKSREDRENAEQERLLAEKRFEEAAEQKYKRRMTEHERTIEQLKAQIDESVNSYSDLLGRYKSVMIQDKLANEFLQAGADPKKLPWIIKAEIEKWDLDTDNSWDPTPIEWINGGKEKITATGADGNPLTMSEHAKGVLQENPWLALESRGAGSTHQNNNGGMNGSFAIPKALVESPGGHKRYMQLKEQAKKAGQEVTITEQ